jgi:hypothetical protein
VRGYYQPLIRLPCIISIVPIVKYIYCPLKNNAFGIFAMRETRLNTILWPLDQAMTTRRLAPPEAWALEAREGTHGEWVERYSKHW